MAAWPTRCPSRSPIRPHNGIRPAGRHKRFPTGDGTQILQQDDPLTYTVPELADRLRLTVGTTYQYLRQGIIPAHRAGRRWIISRERIARWLEEVGEVPQPEPPSSVSIGGPYPWEVR